MTTRTSASADVRASTTAPESRATFTSHLGVIAATLGSAIGLGNIWKFPSLTGTNGGAAFLITYLFATLLVGLPVMIAEISIGRTIRADPITGLRRLAPRQVWWVIGAMGIVSSFLIMAFYTEVVGWVLAFIVAAATGQLQTTSPETLGAHFAQQIGDPAQSILWQWVVLAIVSGIIAFGVTKGIEATTKRLLPILFGLLVLIGIRSLMLPGAGQGLAFLFVPDFSKVTPAVILAALGLAFFKLSLGMGAMMTYGSYFRNDQNIPGTATRVMLADLLVSLLAGVAIFPAVFSFGFEPQAGPALLFITLPAVFAAIPFGQVLLVLFFVLAAIAAVGAMLSMIEVPITSLMGMLGWDRRRATVATLVGLVLFGAPAALSNSVLANAKLFGKTPFDLYDFLTSNLLLPLGGLLICVFVGWFWGLDQFAAALGNPPGQPSALTKALFVLLRFVSPILLVIVLINGLIPA
ncbi:sodium-dependent transporter [Chloroflexia bacterium SDU3-3]|nr:sodium-dependent transporter [Chloroflexia bacterium SDU3-3]